MLRDEPTIRPGLYRMPERPIGPRILIPAYRQATSVRGAFGWFSSGWIARLAPGLATYLNRDDRNPMLFTVAPKFFPRELNTVSNAVHMSEEEAYGAIEAVFMDKRVTEDALGCHALDCLAWMLASGRLIMRIAVPFLTSSYHPKLWLFDDGQDQVLVRGSGNATSKGVYSGVEHMDVDVSWDANGIDRLDEGIEMLTDWELGKSLGIKAIHELPEAVESKILSVAPSAAPSPNDYQMACASERGTGNKVLSTNFMKSDVVPRGQQCLSIPKELDWHNPPYQHQA